MHKNFFQNLNIIWLVLCSAPLLVIPVFYFFNTEGLIPELKNLSEYIALLIAFILLFVANFFYKIQLEKSLGLSLVEKLKQYQKMIFVKAALLENAAMICLIAYLFTKTFWLLAVPITIVIWIWQNRPSKAKFCDEFEVAESDLAEYLG
jgi:Zn-dependent protease with chaperone function